MSSVRIEFPLPFAADGSLAWLTEPQRLVRWWPDEADTDPQVGGAYELRWTGRALRGHYLQVETDHLAFTWKWDHEDLPDRRVDIRVVADGDEDCHWIIDHEAGDDDEGAGYVETWHDILSRLTAVDWP